MYVFRKYGHNFLLLNVVIIAEEGYDTSANTLESSFNRAHDMNSPDSGDFPQKLHFFS